MSIGESIMNMFKTAAPAPAASTTGPGNIPQGIPDPAKSTSSTAPNGVVPNNDTTKNPDGTTKEPAPFEAFAKLWEDTPPDPNAPVKDGTVFGQIDPKKFMEAAGKIDFSKVVTPEQLAAIQAGGEGAATAFAQALNTVAQSTYAQSAFATTKIVEQAVAKSKEAFLAELPQHIKKQTVTDSLRSKNPVLSNPAVKPLIEAMESRFSVKFPDATAPEITQMAENYIAEIGKSFTPKAKPGPEAKTGKGTEPDWEAWLS